MRVAVIGLGTIGVGHVNLMLERKDEIVALCDIDSEKLQKFPHIKGYRDYLQMLDEEKPDVVHICTPHHLHAEMILDALKRDVNVLCEKPLCINLKDISRILQAEKQSKAQLGVCFQNRYNLSSMFVKERLKGKRILSARGFLCWNRDEKYYAQSKWRGRKVTEGGGLLINQAFHTLDLLQWFVGMPNSVIGWCENVSLRNIIEVEDTAMINCKGEVDFSLFATTSAKEDYPTQIVINTQDEEIRLIHNEVYINGQLVSEEKEDFKFIKKIYGEGHKSLIGDFYDCIEKGRKFSIDGDEGAKAVRIVLSVYDSNGVEKQI